MGFLDKAKASLTKAVDQHGDKITKGADSLARAVDKRTGHKHTDKIAKGQAKLHETLEGLDHKRDDDLGPGGTGGTSGPGGPTPPKSPGS